MSSPLSRRRFGFDVSLENDVNLAVLGENWLGQGQGIDNLAYIASAPVSAAA